MDLDKFINENIDDILENSIDFINEKKKINSKKVNFEFNNKEFNKLSEIYDDDSYLESDSDNIDENVNNNNDSYFESNEDDYTEDNIGELYQNMYENTLYKKENIELNNDIDIDNNNDYELDKDEGYYYFNLINIFIKYYNNKFDKKENFFSDINNIEKDTSNQMELFFDALFEYKILKEKLKLDDLELMKNLYSKDDSEKISKLFETWEYQIYIMEINNKKFISPSLIICFNYIYENNFIDLSWNIFNLKNL